MLNYKSSQSDPFLVDVRGNNTFFATNTVSVIQMQFREPWTFPLSCPMRYGAPRGQSQCSRARPTQTASRIAPNRASVIFVFEKRTRNRVKFRR